MSTTIIAERYRVLGALGEGGMGQVLKVEDLHTRRHVALKRLHPSIAEVPIHRQRFRRELEVLRGLDHPSLVRLLDGDFESEAPFLVFDIVEGVDLEHLIADSPLPLRRALSFAMQMAEALTVLHDHEIVHRDLKPSNVMVRPEDHICLLDFGIAKHVGDAQATIDRVTRTGLIVGTPQYMPPEGLTADRPLTPAYDVWALGVILYQMVSGCHPFAVADQSVPELVELILEANVYPLQEVRPDVPRGIVSVVGRFLARDPEDRPPTGREAAEMLAAIAAEGAQRQASRPTELRRGVPHTELFDVLGELGRGGMGVVLRARQRSLDRLVALKIFDPEHSAGASLAMRFRREAAAMVSLKHPNLVHLYDFDLTPEQPYLVIELIEGDGTLQGFIEAGAYAFDRALMICLELVAVVAYLHDNAILHRDLKPANVLMDLQGHPRLTDFGLSRILDPDSTQVTLDGQVMGTLNYMAPEQAMGEQATLSTDVYSLALVVFEVLARRRVFGGDGGQRCPPTERFRRGPPDLTRFCPRAAGPLERLLARCLAPGAGDRPADARVVLAELDPIVDAASAVRESSTAPLRELIRLQVEQYSGKHKQEDVRREIRKAAATVAGVPAGLASTAPASSPPVAPRPRLVRWPLAAVVAGAIALSSLAVLGPVRWSRAPQVSRSVQPSASPVRVAKRPADACRGSWARLKTAAEAVVGSGAERLEPLLESLRPRLADAGSVSCELAMRVQVGEARLEQLRRTLREACTVVDADRTGVAVDRQLLSQLGAVEVVDELAHSMGESPVFGGQLMPVMGPYAGIRELAEQEGAPVIGLHPRPVFHVLGEIEWDLVLPSAPPADVDLTLACNSLDPKAVLQVTLNRQYRAYYRNRSGIAGGYTYKVPEFLLPGWTVPQSFTYFPDHPFARYCILTRRIPRGVLRKGSNRLNIRCVSLPGRLRLPKAKQWVESDSIHHGAVWHVYAAYLPRPSGPDVSGGTKR